MRAKTTSKPRKPMALPEDDDALIREDQVLSVFPTSPSSWRRGVARGIYPRGYLIAPRQRAWTVGSIRKLLATVVAGNR